MSAAAVLSPLHADALRELCNVCGGRAADALSMMLGERPVELGIPGELDRSDAVRALGGAEAQLVAARVELAGPLEGELWMVLPERDAAELSGLLDQGAGAGVAVWALYETANIVASACLNALYALTGLTVVPSVPEVGLGAAAKVLAGLGQAERSDAPMIATGFSLRDAPVRGRLLFAPSHRSVAPLLKAMGVG